MLYTTLVYIIQYNRRIRIAVNVQTNVLGTMTISF